MKIFNESEIKYLAGLLDADGCLSFSFVDDKLYMEMSLAASESIDKHGYIKTLSDKLGWLSIREWPEKNWAPSHQWRVTSRRDLNVFLPRVVKHMVIKGAHWKRMYDKYVELQGVSLTKDEQEEIKLWSKASRTNSGPLKPKNHPTWAWVAGYLDGDGFYSFKKHSNKEAKNCMTLRVGAVTHKNDLDSIKLLVKAFGGSTREEGEVVRWQRSLGVKDASFALSFLRKVHRHSRLKKWKIEQMLAFHNNRLQRLTEKNSKE